jgi:hypothetical protein
MNSKLFERLQEATAEEVGRATSAAGPYLCGDIDIRIARDGTWFYHGSPIGRKPLVKLFASVLRRESDGDYWLVTPVEKARIKVDDAPFVVVELRAQGNGRDMRLEMRTNLDDWVPVDGDHPIRVDHDAVTAEPSPYLRVRDGLDALIARSVFYELVELGAENEETGDLEIWSEGRPFTLGRLADPG